MGQRFTHLTLGAYGSSRGGQLMRFLQLNKDNEPNGSLSGERFGPIILYICFGATAKEMEEEWVSDSRGEIA